MTSHRFRLIPNLALGLALVLSSAVGAKASNIGYTSSNALRDNSGADITYGFWFTPNQDITIDHLGVYNNGGNLNDAHEVGLWLSNDGGLTPTTTLPLVSVTVPKGACTGTGFVLSNNFCLLPLTTPLSLSSALLPDQRYVVGAYYPAPSNPSNPPSINDFDSFSTMTASNIVPTPGITLIPDPITQGLRTLFNNGSSLAFPTPSDSNGTEMNGTFFSSANFSFTLGSGGGGGGGGTNIPEPSFVNAFLVFALVGWLNRKKSESVSKK